MASSSSSNPPSSSSKPPLHGLKVVEFAGLAPGPLVGLILADFGADVVRIDRITSTGLNPDPLCRGKRSIAVDPKHPKGKETLEGLIGQADVLIDPFRPGVLERLGLGPESRSVKGNEKLVFARLTGFQREGPYSKMAGHDINYIALSGLLSMLGPAGGAPQPPINILGDFAGGSLICLLGILLALVERSKSGKGQVVEADMVTGSRYISTMILLSSYVSHPVWGKAVGNGTDSERGKGMLDGGAPWYGVYACQDSTGWMSVGAIEPQFYSLLLELLKENLPSYPPLPHPKAETQHDTSTWPSLRRYFTKAFASKTRSEWEEIFTGTDACVVPVLTRDEAAIRGTTPSIPPPPSSNRATEEEGEEEDPTIVVPSPAPRLSRTPAKIISGTPESYLASSSSSSAQGPTSGQDGSHSNNANAKDEQNQTMIGEEDGEIDTTPTLLLTCGEHSSEILTQWLGFDSVKIGELGRSGGVGGIEEDEDEEDRGEVKSKL